MATETKKKKKFELPHVYTIAFMLIILFAVLTWIVPSGQFERQTVETAAGEREVAVAGTYHEVPKLTPDGVNLRQGVFEVLQAPTQGIQAAADVVAFVLLIGGSFALITKTNAINAGVSHVIKKLGGRDHLLIPVIMVLFSIGGTTFGMSEEALPFYAIFLPIIMGLGYDSMTAFMICFLGPNMGYIGSTVNPFNVLIAQGLIQINGNPQLWLRAIFYVIFVAVGIIFVSSDLVRVCFGEEFVMSPAIPVALAINFYLVGMQSAVWTYMQTLGIFHYGRLISFVTAGIKIALSILLGADWGVFGIQISTALARIVTDVWYSPWALYKYGFRKKSAPFFGRYLLYLLVLCAECGVCYLLCAPIAIHPVVDLLLKFLICSIVPNLIFLLVFGRTRDFAMFKKAVGNMLDIVKSKFTAKGKTA